MKANVIAILLLCVSQIAITQDKNLDFDKEYFLLGTLWDYMGREIHNHEIHRVDMYSKNRSGDLPAFIISMFEDTYPYLILDTTANAKWDYLYAEGLAKKMNDFYEFKPSGRRTYIGDMDLRTANLDSIYSSPEARQAFYSQFDTIYQGRLRSDIFDTDLQKISFIVGAYSRYGWQNDSTHIIKLYNSVSKAKTLDKLIKEIGCRNTSYEIMPGIPATHKISFTPTKQLISHMERVYQQVYPQ